MSSIIEITVKKSGNVVTGYFRYTAPSNTTKSDPIICTYPSKYDPVTNSRIQGVAQQTWTANKSSGYNIGNGIVNIAAKSYEAGLAYVFSASWIIAN